MHRFLKSLGFGRIAKNRVDGWSGIEMGNVLLLEELPYQRIIDLSQAVVSSTNSSYCPRECPAYIFSISRTRLL
jgi:hypothetical protein